MINTLHRSYEYYKNALAGQHLPAAFVDVDLLEANINAIKERAGSKLVRIASKSIRCIAVLQKILDFGKPYRGIMTYTANEALFLSQHGFDNLLVAYPRWHIKELEGVAKAVSQGSNIVLMVDDLAHINRLNDIGAQYAVKIPVCLDIDMSSNYPGIYFGVYRSPINTLAKAKAIIDQMATAKQIALVGIMGYEAQIAGLGDKGHGLVKNTIIKRLKKQSINEITQRRAAIVQYAEQQVGHLQFVNGGGTGSLESTIQEQAVTEVTVGSGFYSPGLFDNYHRFKHLPAAAYAIEIVRKPKNNLYTCAGGGYTASGAIAADKQPKIYFPKGAKLTVGEGCGEVQTPIIYKGNTRLQLGDPVFLRHSKAGELCERFNEILMIKGGQVVASEPTYRGMGQCFM